MNLARINKNQAVNQQIRLAICSTVKSRKLP
nr:MAG TPA: hypothetical protein [Caudoviricetes sp.]